MENQGIFVEDVLLEEASKHLSPRNRRVMIF